MNNCLIDQSANSEDGARLDIVAESFWGRDWQCTFFDVQVFNPFAQSYRNTSLAQCYRQNEMEKRRAYDERVREIKHGSFSPLVFSTTGGMGPTASVVYKRIASMVAENRKNPTAGPFTGSGASSTSPSSDPLSCASVGLTHPFIVQPTLSPLETSTLPVQRGGSQHSKFTFSHIQ